MLELNAANYQPWYNVVVLLLLTGLGAVLWMRALWELSHDDEIVEQVTAIATMIIVVAWAVYSVAIQMHHLWGWPKIH